MIGRLFDGDAVRISGPTALKHILAGVDRTDPLPTPGDTSGRDSMHPDEQRRMIYDGERVSMRVFGLRTEWCAIEYTWPSGFSERIPYSRFDRYAETFLGIGPGMFRNRLLAYLTDNKDIVFFPNEKMWRSRLKMEDGTEVFIV